MSEIMWFAVFWLFFFGVGFAEYLLDRDQGPSLRLQRWPVNIAFGVANGVLVSILPIGLITLVLTFQESEFGLFHQCAAPFWVVAVATVLVRDAAQFLFHWLAHVWPMLWRFHAVHHSDPHVDISTGLRFHPVELVANIVFVAPFLLILGADPTVLAVFEAFSVLFGLFAHTSFRIPGALERWLPLVVITPGIHRVHHSNLPSDFDRNFGVVFSIWDRIAGTLKLRTSREDGKPQMGVSSLPPPRALDLAHLIVPRLGAVEQRGAREGDA